MASSTAFPPADDPDKPCEKCGTPASLAEEWNSNMSYSEGLEWQMKRYCASPRMWPIGYITNDPYSPLYVERQMPNKQHWRDAFEDLVALESGGQMIDPEARHREAVVAERLWTEKIHRNVSSINQLLKHDEKYMSLLKRMRAAFVRKNETGMINLIDEKAIPLQRDSSEKSIAEGQREIAMLQDKESHGRPASMYKLRGQWIASLVSSGAISGWETNLYDSSEGLYVQYQKTEPAENGEHDGLMVTETELKNQFEEGVHPNSGPPLWSTASLRYPDSFSPFIEGPTEDSIGDPDIDDAESKPPQVIRPISPLFLMPMSILAQNIIAERTMLGNGKMSVNVLLKNYHTNGTLVKKEIRDDACKVLEEVDRAHDSMNDMHNAILKVGREQQYALQEDATKAAEDDLD